MFRRFLRSSIQKALVTGTRHQGDGGITLDRALMDAAGLFPNEIVLCTNENNGRQFWTYVTRGKRGRGDLILNGPIARQGTRGDRLTIDRYDALSDDQVNRRNPKVVLIDRSTT